MITAVAPNPLPIRSQHGPVAGEALRFRLLGAVQARRGDEELDLDGRCSGR